MLEKKFEYFVIGSRPPSTKLEEVLDALSVNMSKCASRFVKMYYLLECARSKTMVRINYFFLQACYIDEHVISGHVTYSLGCRRQMVSIKSK